MGKSDSESEEWVHIHFFMNKGQKLFKNSHFLFIISAIEGTLEFINPFYRWEK